MSSININSLASILGSTITSPSPLQTSSGATSALPVNTATSLTSSPLLLNTTVSPLTVLSQASAAAAQATIELQLNAIQTTLTNQLNAKIAAAEETGNPTPAEAAQQDQIDSLTQRSSTINTAETQYGTNSNVFADLTQQLATLKTAATASNSQAFDTALANANTDVSNLQVVAFNPLFQDDGVANLKITGLAIQSSSTYDLSTPQGQAAALAAISQAQQVVSQSSATTALNQNEAGTQVLALNNLLSTINANLQQAEVAQITASTQEVSDLQQQLQDQIHLIQLDLGSSTGPAQSLENQATAVQNLYAPPAPGTVLSILA